LILYDVPSRTVAGLAGETVARLAELPQVIGLKDATGDVTRPARLRPLVGSEFRLLSGDDATAFAFIAQGGDGSISVTSNAVPGLCRAVFLHWRQGRIPRAQRLAMLLARLTAALSRETNPAPVKYALSLLGLMSAKVRLPLVEPTEHTKREIEAALASVHHCYADYVIADASRINGNKHVIAR
jgi:4-hydroxy-tetrahydrodipicolinate synthase